MATLRLFAVLFFILFLFAPVYASGIQEEKPADSQPPPVVMEKPYEKPQPVIKAEPVIKSEPQTKTELVIEAAPAAKPETESEIVPYKSNPIAVKAVEKNTELFAERIRERFSMWLSRSGKYVELMKEILKNKNVPEDIVFLSLVESGFNPYAYSVAKAAGPWQFISSTAKRYGLVIDWWRDERRDPVKSTTAAANYLTDLYGMFGSWNLAMAAYNAGEGKIMKALRRSKSDDYWPLLNTKHIRSETKNYVPRFIAASNIASNPEEFGFKDIVYHQPLNFDEVMITSPVDLEVAAKCAGTTIEIIKELNPELRRWCTPPHEAVYVLRIPAGTKQLFEQNLAAIPENERFSVVTYTVKKGDTLQKIAKKTGVTVKTILVLNSMDKARSLKPGTPISLPPKEKFQLDREDKYEIRKASYKSNKKSKKAGKAKKINTNKTTRTKNKNKSKKMLVTAFDKKRNIAND